MTSIIPGFNGSMTGTWFAKIPMSPDAAEMLTCVTSCEE